MYGAFMCLGMYGKAGRCRKDHAGMNIVRMNAVRMNFIRRETVF